MYRRLLVIFFVIPQLLTAQGGFVSVRGKIVGKETLLPILDAYITIPTSGFGNGVNAEGEFLFKFPALSLDSELVISAVGYHALRGKASTFINDSVTFYYLEIAEPIVANLGISDAKVLVQAAIDSIPANYPSGDFFQNGFYLEKTSIINLGVVKINEALIRVERLPKDKDFPSKIKALRSRALDWKGQSAKVDGWGFGNGAEVVTRALETEIPEFLSKKSINNYFFDLDSVMTLYENFELYGIEFKPKNDKVRGGRIGKIYIEPRSKAIVRISYMLTPQGIQDIVKSGSSNIKVKGNSVSAAMQYGRSGDKWVLREQRIDFNANFEDRLDKKFRIDSEISIRFIANESAILRRKSIREEDVLLSTNEFTKGTSLSPDLWGGSNYLIPTGEMFRLIPNLRY